MTPLRRPLIAANLAALVVLTGLLWSRATPATDAAERAVRERVQYASTVAPGEPREYLVALAVNGHVSAADYGYLNTISGGPLPKGDSLEVVAEKALTLGAGICGQAAATAMVLYKRLGIAARLVHISGPAGGHVSTEVFYEGSWHWFDPTFGYFYRNPDARPEDVYSLVTVLGLADPAADRVGSDTPLWAQVTISAQAETGNGLDITGESALRVALDDGTEIYHRG